MILLIKRLILIWIMLYFIFKHIVILMEIREVKLKQISFLNLNWHINIIINIYFYHLNQFFNNLILLISKKMVILILFKLKKLYDNI